MEKNSFSSRLYRNFSILAFVGYSIGLSIGLVYGVAFNNLGVGVLLGIFFGFILATTLEKLQQAI